MKATLKSVAQRAGVSVATVSMVLNDKPCRASQATKEPVSYTHLCSVRFSVVFTTSSGQKKAFQQLMAFSSTMVTSEGLATGTSTRHR